MNFYKELELLMTSSSCIKVKGFLKQNIIEFDIDNQLNIIFNHSINKDTNIENLSFQHRFDSDNYKIIIRNNIVTLKFDNDFNPFIEFYEDQVEISSFSVKMKNKKTNINKENLSFVIKNINYNEEDIFDLLNINFDVNINNDDFYKKLIINLKKIETVIISNKKELNKTLFNKKDKKI